MTLPTSGPLSLSDIQTEFGGSNPISLNEYYAGGTYVPSGTTGTYGAVPTSGAISIQNFYGTQASSNTITIIPGHLVNGTSTWDGFGTTAYTSSPSDFGSISGTNKVTVFGGAALQQCYWFGDTFFGIYYFSFVMSGNQTGTTWASITVDGTTFTKAAMGGAGSYNSGGNYTYWSVSSVSTPFAAFPSTVVFA